MLEAIELHLKIWSYGIIFDFVRYLWGAGGVFLIVWVLFKNKLQGRKIRTKTPKVRQMVREFAMSMVTVCVYGLVGFIIYYGRQYDVISFYEGSFAENFLYSSGALLLMIVAHDAYFYWTHRAMHIPGVMKYIHGEHHKSMNPTPWTAYRFDAFEAASHALFMPIFLVLVPVNFSIIILFLGHMIVRNAVGHCGYELFPRTWATNPVMGIITLVTHHDMHHSNGKYNFGLYFSYWDRWMGTENPDYITRATLIKGATRQNYKELVGAQQIAAE